MSRRRRKIKNEDDALQTMSGIFIGTGLGLLVWMLILAIYKAVT